MDEDGVVHVHVPARVREGVEAVVARNKQVGQRPNTLAAAITSACNSWLVTQLAGYEPVEEEEEVHEAIPLQILRGIRQFTTDLDGTFSREDIRKQLEVAKDRWGASYSPTFQAMRQDQPGGAPLIGAKYRGTVRRLHRGVYSLTDRGKQILTRLGI